MRAAIYARVSTTDQHNEIQVRELSEYVARRGWTVAQVYQDQMSGAKARRPGLDALMADARARRIDVIVVWKLDRFGRSLVHCVNGIQELASVGVRFIAVSQGLDTDQSSPTSQLLLHILAAVAQFEKELIGERVAAGVKQHKANLALGRIGKDLHTRSGKDLPTGRPKKVFDRVRASELRAQGWSWGAIATELDVPQATVRRAVTRLSKAVA